MTDPLKELRETRQCHCLAARRKARELTRRYEVALRPHGLRATQFSVLAALTQTGPVPLSKLADILGLERTTLTRVAGVMERDGRITVTAGEDGRVRVLAVTNEGNRVLAKAFPAWKKVQEAINNEG